MKQFGTEGLKLFKGFFSLLACNIAPQIIGYPKNFDAQTVCEILVKQSERKKTKATAIVMHYYEKRPAD